MGAAPAPARLYGSNTSSQVPNLPHLVDVIAAQEPSRPWVYTPLAPELKQGWQTITFQELAQAVNGTAKWIENKIGLGLGARNSVAYLGVNDYRYLVVSLALLKTNRKAVLLSLRNSEEAQTHLLNATKCDHYLYSEGIGAALDVINKASKEMSGYQIPTFDQMVEEGKGEQYPSSEQDDIGDEILVMHSSGSTGLPKPIPITNGWITSLALHKHIILPPGRTLTTHGLFCNEDEPLLAITPFFHAMGFAALSRSIFTGPLVVPPVERRVDAELVRQVLMERKATSVILPPSVLTDLTESEEGLEALSTVQHVIYGGAPLPKEAGDKIIKVTKLHAGYGSTEASVMAMVDPEDPVDWQYYQWHPASCGLMEDAGEGLYELTIQRPRSGPLPAVFYTFPEIREWRTKDLWEPHPSKPDLYRYKGRRDDVIVFSNGEKFTPLQFEATVESSPLVRGAIMVGQNRFQPGLLIEPSQFDDPNILLDEIWPVVEKANEAAPAFAKVWRNKIAFAKKEKPFSRAGKGSIQRHATNKLYEPEIAALYANEGFDQELGTLSRQAPVNEIREFVRKAVKLSLPSVKGDIADDTNIFDLGVDSLASLALSSSLSHAVRSSTGNGDRSAAVAPRDIYDNPSISKLSAAIYAKIHRRDSAHDEPKLSPEAARAEMVKKYTEDLPKNVPTRTAHSGQKQVVVLTGSTGSLGTKILRDLIASPNVSHVYCLNRSETAKSRQADAFKSANIPVDFSKVTFQHADFGKPHFGLQEVTYTELLKTTTTFIHNAWAVDFNHPLEGFEQTHIAGTRRVVDFSLESEHRAQILFISSIASVGNWPAIGSGPVPEKFIEDDRAPLPQGYGESKHVAGRILAYAAQHCGVPVSIVRCGQLAGPTEEKGGVWNKHEWLPSLVLTSKAMGLLPANLGNQERIDWVPMDAAARTVVEVAEKRLETQKDTLLDVFHVVNPQVVSWSSLVPVIKDYYEKQGKSLKVVSFDEWMRALKAVPLTKEEALDKPGVKLIDFYEGLKIEGGALPEMATAHTAESSECLRTLGPVDKSLLEMWLRQWDN